MSECTAQEHADAVRDAHLEVVSQVSRERGQTCQCDRSYYPCVYCRLGEKFDFALDALLAHVERLEARMVEARKAIRLGVRQREAAEALAERRLADLRTYFTHCGYPEWYGDEERAWLHAALADSGQE